MIAPTRRCALLCAALIPLALLPALVAPTLWATWAGALALVLVLLLADLSLSPAAARLRVEHQAPQALLIGERGRLALRLEADAWRRAFEVEVVCDLDELLEPQPALLVAVPAEAAVEVELELLPRRRGTSRLEALWLRWTGPLGLVQRTRRVPLEVAVAVVPNTRAVRAAALRFLSSRQFVAGIKVERYVGEGSEFESLREYVPGHDLRSIHWKASARRRKLLVREYRAERNHQVLLAFDTGYLMSEPLPETAAGASAAPRRGIPRLDHAIQAGLLLTYVALRTGDRVGLLAFDDRPRLFVEPRRGPHVFRGLQRRTSALEYSRAETNFTLGLIELSRRLRRRSLVIVLTDFVDTVTAELMVENLGRLAQRHLVLFVALRDGLLDRLSGARPAALEDVGRAVVARDLLREREVVLRRLHRLGVHCVDALPSAISAGLVNRYLDIRRRELL